MPVVVRRPSAAVAPDIWMAPWLMVVLPVKALFPKRIKVPVPALVSEPAPLLIVVFDAPEPMLSALPVVSAAPEAGATAGEEPLVMTTSS